MVVFLCHRLFARDEEVNRLVKRNSDGSRVFMSGQSVGK